MQWVGASQSGARRCEFESAMFAGSYEATIDAKNRIGIPFRLQRKIHEAKQGDAYFVVPGRRKGTLTIFTEKRFEGLHEQLPQPELLSDDASDYVFWELSQSYPLEPDGQGRLTLPERLLKQAGIEREIMIVGAIDRLELWNRAEFEQYASHRWTDYPQRKANVLPELRKYAEPKGAAANPPAPE